MHWFWICLLCLGVSCARPKPPAKPLPPSPKPVAEVRAVWVSDTTKLDWDAATRDLQRAGFNTMYVNLASAGTAFYPGSRVLPSIEDRSDPVARGIALARQRGIAVHAKQIVMFSFKSPGEFQRTLLKSDRVMRGADGKPIVQSGCYWVCPSHPANRADAVAAIGEMLSRYPVDGLQFDYIRFNEDPSCFCARCRRDNVWRENLLTDWMRELSAKARATRPGIQLSAAVFPVLERAREEKAQNWKLWLDRGYLDVICPMNYTTDAKDFEQRSRGILALAARPRVVMGIGSWKFDKVEGMAGQIEITRRLGCGGFALFSYDDAAARDCLPKVSK